MSKYKSYNDITLDDVQEQYRWIAELIGLDNLIAFCQNAGGTHYYIPLFENLIKNQRYIDIINEFDGYNIKYLVKKYKVSESTVRRLVKDKLEAKRKSPMEGQLSLL